MKIEDFIPFYPYPNDENISGSISDMKQFQEKRLEPIESIPEVRGNLMNHQHIISRLLSSTTPYNELLLVHEMGTGKTCSAISVVEQHIRENNYQITDKFRSAYIFTKNQQLLDNFKMELINKCTSGKYKVGYNKFYKFSYGNRLNTFETFAKMLEKRDDKYIVDNFSNIIIIIDEVHNLKLYEPTYSKKKGKIVTVPTDFIYKQFWRFLHLVKGCKVLLLTGTPMVNDSFEIANIMNLILAPDKQLPTKKKFIKYMNNNINNFKESIRGRISYLKAIANDNVEKKFIGRVEPNLKHFIVDLNKMSDFQSKHYLKALQNLKDEKKAFYINAIQASLFIYPTGDWGDRGFKKHLIPTPSIHNLTDKYGNPILDKNGKNKKRTIYSYSLHSNFKKVLLMGTQNVPNKHNIILNNIKKYSIKYYETLKKIVLGTTDQSCFVYCRFVTGSGAILFSKLLELFDYKKSNGKHGKTEKLRYGILTTHTEKLSDIRNIINMFNIPENKNGKIIKVIIGSKVISEGVSFRNIQNEFILTPWFNYAEIDQAIARGYRVGSHKDLLENSNKVVMNIYQMVADIGIDSKDKNLPKANHKSIDLLMYKISEDKDIAIQYILRILKESSLDCYLNYKRNYMLDWSNNSRDCEYQSCEYKCDGKTGIWTDQSSYYMYWFRPSLDPIRRHTETIFRNKGKIDKDVLISILKKEFTEVEIINSLGDLFTKGNILNYSDFISMYNDTKYNSILIYILTFFKQQSFIHIEQLTSDNNNKFNEIELLTVLSDIIETQIPIYDRYGFKSQLQEYSNIYYLSPYGTPTIGNKWLIEYYSDNIIGYIGNDLSDTLYLLQNQKEFILNNIHLLFKVKDINTFKRIICNLPKHVIIMLLKQIIISQQKGKQSNFFNLFITYFEANIKKINDNYILAFPHLDSPECLVARDDGSLGWERCSSDFIKIIEKDIENKKAILETNPYGYYGKYNPQSGAFSIVNLEKQKEILEKKKNEIINKIQKLNISENEKKERIKMLTVDSRTIYSGKVCSSWSKGALQTLLSKLKIEYDKKQGKKELCNTLFKWFENTKYKEVSLLLKDNTAGLSNLIKKIEKESEEEKENITVISKVFNTKDSITKQDKNMFKYLKKDLPKLDKYIEWYFIYINAKKYHRPDIVINIDDNEKKKDLFLNVIYINTKSGAIDKAFLKLKRQLNNKNPNTNFIIRINKEDENTYKSYGLTTLSISKMYIDMII